MLNIHTKIYFDDDAVKKHSDELGFCGDKALIVTGHSSEKNGALNDVVDVLKSQNIGYEIFNEVEENPSIETVMNGREFGLKNSCNFLIAIGGGSIMDAAKAIAIMMANADKNENFLYDSSKGILNHAINLANDDRSSSVRVDGIRTYELIAIPTTCGSGAEVTGNAVLTIHKK